MASAGVPVVWWKNGDHPKDYVGVAGEAERCRDAGYEGKVVRRYRHPDVPGNLPCKECGVTFADHGWIDSGGLGQKVCPGDWIYPDLALGWRAEHPLVGAAGVAEAPPVFPAGIYRHYKGPLYLALGLAHDANVDDEHLLVVYVGLTLDGAHEGPRLAVRNYIAGPDAWMDQVCIEKNCVSYGKNVAFVGGEHRTRKRFTYLASEFRAGMVADGIEDL